MTFDSMIQALKQNREMYAGIAADPATSADEKARMERMVALTDKQIANVSKMAGVR